MLSEYISSTGLDSDALVFVLVALLLSGAWGASRQRERSGGGFSLDALSWADARLFGAVMSHHAGDANRPHSICRRRL